MMEVFLLFNFFRSREPVFTTRFFAPFRSHFLQKELKHAVQPGLKKHESPQLLPLFIHHSTIRMNCYIFTLLHCYIATLLHFLSFPNRKVLSIFDFLQSLNILLNHQRFLANSNNNQYYLPYK